MKVTVSILIDDKLAGHTAYVQRSFDIAGYDAPFAEWHKSMAEATLAGMIELAIGAPEPEREKTEEGRVSDESIAEPKHTDEG